MEYKPKQLLLPYLVGINACTLVPKVSDRESLNETPVVCPEPQIELEEGTTAPTLSEREQMNRRCGQLFGYKKACATKVIKFKRGHTNVICGEGK